MTKRTFSELTIDKVKGMRTIVPLHFLWEVQCRLEKRREKKVLRIEVTTRKK